MKRYLIYLIQNFSNFFFELLAKTVVVALEKKWIKWKKIHPLFYEAGFHLLRKNFYLPIPEGEDLKYADNSALVGIPMNDDEQIDFLDTVVAKYKGEFLAFPMHAAESHQQFHLINGSFMAGDGNAYYGLVRYLKPKTVIEIGSGQSTLLASHALRKNHAESPGYAGKLVAIEPYPAQFLLDGLPHVAELKVCKVQEVPLEYFERLKAGDILFIDSSHVLRTGGDVWWEYCEILPRLNSGVYVHVHDISLPKPYFRLYYDSFLYWNEQYLLQAFLTHNDRIEVVWAGTYMLERYPEHIQKAFSPEFELMREKYPLAEPSSFWFRIK